MLKRGDKVYTEIAPDCKSITLQRIIKGKTGVDSVIHSDGWREYNGLVDFGYKKHFRVRHSKNEFARGKIIVFGLLKRGDQMYTEIVPDCKSATLQRIIKGKTSIDSVILPFLTLAKNRISVV